MAFLASSGEDRIMKTALIISVALHVLLLVIGAVGLPWIKKDLPKITPPPSIDIEFVAPSPKKAKPKAPKKPPAPKPAPPSKPKPPPKMTANQAPDLSKVKAPPLLDKTPPPPEAAKSVPVPKNQSKTSQSRRKKS